MTNANSRSVNLRRSSTIDETETKNTTAAAWRAPESTARRNGLAEAPAGSSNCARKCVKTNVHPTDQSVRRAQRVWRLRQAKIMTSTQTVTNVGNFWRTPIGIAFGGRRLISKVISQKGCVNALTCHRRGTNEGFEPGEHRSSGERFHQIHLVVAVLVLDMTELIAEVEIQSGLVALVHAAEILVRPMCTNILLAGSQ